MKHAQSALDNTNLRDGYYDWNGWPEVCGRHGSPRVVCPDRPRPQWGDVATTITWEDFQRVTDLYPLQPLLDREP